MKKSGHTSYFTSQRNRELMQAFRRVLAQKRYFDIKKDFQLVVEQPCSRFWVSEERATAVISAMLRNQPILYTLRPSKQEMFLEIYLRVLALKAESPSAPLFDLVFSAVNSPAPKFYMTPKYASDTIYKILKSKKNVKSA